MRPNALPPHQPHKRLPLLPLVLHLINHPPPRRALEPLGATVRNTPNEPVEPSFEAVGLVASAFAFEIAGQDFGDGGGGTQGGGGRVRGEIRVVHRDGAVDDGREVCAKGPVDRGGDEFLVVLERVPVYAVLVCFFSSARYLTIAKVFRLFGNRGERAGSDWIGLVWGQASKSVTDEELEHAWVLDLAAPVGPLEAVLLRYGGYGSRPDFSGGGGGVFD